MSAIATSVDTHTHKIYDDDFESSGEQVLEVVAAGLECVDYSMMGKRQRLAGRSTLNQVC